MMPGLYAKDMSVEAFLALAGGFSWPAGAILSAFSPGRAVFDKFFFDKSFFAASDSGRIFSPEGEFKWRAMGGSIRIVALGDLLPFQGLDDFSFELETLTPEYDEVFLWGERTENEPEWIEQQAPHRFFYPLSDCRFPRGRIALVMEKWVDATGLPVFCRYHSIKEMPGGNYAAK